VKSNLKIYSTRRAKPITMEQALKEMTEEQLDHGNYCTQTLIDALDCCRVLWARVKELEHCKEKERGSQ
jgi:hypothetical protein